MQAVCLDLGAVTNGILFLALEVGDVGLVFLKNPFLPLPMHSLLRLARSLLSISLQGMAGRGG